MGVSGRTKTAHQLLQALAGLAQGVSSGLIKGWEIQSDQEKEKWQRDFQERQQKETERYHRSMEEDRDAARGLREKAMLGKGTGSDFAKFALGLGPDKSIPAEDFTKGRVAAIQRYHDMRDSGADAARAMTEMGLMPSEEKISMTSPLAMLFPDKKPDKDGYIKVTRDEFAQARNDTLGGTKHFTMDPEVLKSIAKESGDYFQTPIGKTGLTTSYLNQKWDEWQALKASQGASSGPASRPASQPSMAGQMQSSGLQGLTPEQWGGQQQTGMAGRVQNLQLQKQQLAHDLMSGDQSIAGAAYSQALHVWPQLPPPPWMAMQQAAQQGIAGPTQPSPADQKYQRADKLSLTPNASRPAPASVTSRPAPTTGGTRRMLPIEKR